jgi:hypothetical protein
MRLALRSRQTCIGAAVLGGSLVLICSAWAGGRERGRPIEFSAPKSDEVTTNLHQLTSKKDGLKQLEEDLYKPLESFAPKSSLDGVAARPVRPPARSVIENKRVKDLLERRKNWIFMNPDELLNAPSLEEMLKTPRFSGDGEEKKDLPPIQSFYHRLANKHSGKEMPIPGRDEELFGSSAKTRDKEEASARDDSSLPRGVKESADTLSKLFRPKDDEDSFSQSASRGTLEDTFGLALKEPTVLEVKEHAKFLTNYRLEADPTWKPAAPAAPESALANMLDLTAPSANKPSVTLPTVASAPGHNVLDTQADVLNPRLGPLGLPDVNAQALGQPRSSDVFPKIETTRVMPPAPTFEIPKRSFR